MKLEPKKLEGGHNPHALLEAAKLRTYKWGENIIDDDYSLYYGDSPVAANENIVLLFGREKSRKSLLADCIAASFFSPKYSLGFRGKLDHNKAMLYFDSEQGMSRFKKNRRRFFDMCGKPINNYFNYNLRPFSTHERITVIDGFIKEIQKTIPIGVIIIDGFVDLCTDYNDYSAVRETVEALMTWTDETKALMIGVLHSNRGGKDSNGVLGSTLDKKVDVSFRVEYDENTQQSSVSHALSRERRIPNFVFEQKKGMPHLCGGTPF